VCLHGFVRRAMAMRMGYKATDLQDMTRINLVRRLSSTGLCRQRVQNRIDARFNLLIVGQDVTFNLRLELDSRLHRTLGASKVLTARISPLSVVRNTLSSGMEWDGADSNEPTV
jgi:hypothetical protein